MGVALTSDVTRMTRARARVTRETRTTRVHICHVAKTDDVERVRKMASPISKRFISKKNISPSGMSHIPLCSARPHGHR